MPWIAVIALLALVVLFYYFWHSRQDGALTPINQDNAPQTFNFEADQGIAALSRRKLRIEAPGQIARGKRQPVRIERKPLPALEDLKPPPEKKIDALLVAVINPVVFAAQTGEPLVTFDPPLTVTIYYDKADAEKTKSDNGLPRLSIVSAYESADGWKFEKLPTVVKANADGNGGTLVAQLWTLEPNDPLWVGMP